MKTFSSFEELLSHLGIGRTKFFAMKKQGHIQIDIQYSGNSKLYILKNEYTEGHGDTGKQLEEWIEWREQGLYAKPWSLNYKKAQIGYLRKYLDEHSTVTPASVESWISRTPVVQHSKKRSMHSAVSSYSRFLYLKGHLSSEEYLKIKSLCPRKSPQYKPKQRLIYDEDLQRLIVESQKAHSSYQALLNTTLLIFLSETGLRISECCTLEREDLRFNKDPKQAFIKVKQGKGGKSRIIPFSKKAQQCIQEYLTKRPSSDTNGIFIAFNPKFGYTPLSKDCVCRRFQALSKKTGIPFSAHSLRHYRITKWANNPRIPITVVQKWAGHSSLEITQRYIHIRDEDALLAAFE